MNKNCRYFRLAIEIFQISRKIEGLLEEGYGVQMRFFASLKQIIAADPEELRAYVAQLGPRVAAHLEYLAERDSQALARMDEIFNSLQDMELEISPKYHSRLIGRANLIDLILSNLIEMSRLIERQGYPVTNSIQANLYRLMLKPESRLIEILVETQDNLQIYKKTMDAGA